MPAETHSHREFDLADIRRVVCEQADELLGIPDADESTPLPDDAVAIRDLVDAVAEELAERTIGLDLDEAVTDWNVLGDVVTHLAAVLGAEAPAPALAEEASWPACRALDGLESGIGYTFNDPAVLRQALHHRSYVAEHEGAVSNERLEFLGDAVLGIVVTDALYRRWPELPEGSLAKARAAVVSSEYLASQASRYDIGAHVFLGKGEHQSGGREKPSILADAMEAIIGAVYLDGGMGAASDFVLEVVGDGLQAAVTGEGHKDFKTRLQELSAHVYARLPTYEVEARGPDHAKEFQARVILAGRIAGVGRGRSKKQAEQAAARQAWEADGARLQQQLNSGAPVEGDDG